MSVHLAFDVGGTKFQVAAGTGDGTVLRVVRAATPAGLEEGLGLLVSMGREVLAGDRPEAAGVAIGGPLDVRTGVVSPLHQPAWRGVRLREILEAEFGCPVRIDVDTNVAAVGEYVLGRHGAERLLYLTISTGMGGGMVVGGRVHRGARGAHPEAAHQAVPFRCRHPERVACECGAPDCLEALVSGNAIRRIYGVRGEELRDDAAWEEIGFNLGLGIRNLAVLYAPDVVVLGGAIGVRRGGQLLPMVREVLAERLRLVPTPEVKVSSLDYDTAVRGALVYATRSEW